MIAINRIDREGGLDTFGGQSRFPSADTFSDYPGGQALNRTLPILFEGHIDLAATGVVMNLVSVSTALRDIVAASSPIPADPLEGSTDLPPPLPHYVVSGGRTAFAIRLLDDALARFRKPDGYEGDLMDAAEQLQEIGRDAWPALVKVAVSNSPECEFFVAAIVRMKDVQPEDRRSVLLTVAKNPDINVRSRLLELVDELPEGLQRDVVTTLAGRSNPDDAVTDRAREVREMLRPANVARWVQYL